MSSILLTGGAGYIGSHTASLLAEEGKEFVILDNLSNSKKSYITKLEKIFKKKINFIKGDIRDTNNLIDILQMYDIHSVIHFAAKKSVDESIKNPLEYYTFNVLGTISLLNAMNQVGVKNLIFSSSATIYGEPEYLPVDEKHKLNPINPYGESKMMIEKIISDLVKSDKDWSIVSLRYFNPIGSHPFGMLGDDPTKSGSKNIMPVILQVAKGQRKHVKIFGIDYDTPDGSGIRDYIHIMDLANAHLKALNLINKVKGLNVFNLGTGRGFSVLELIDCFEEATKIKIPRLIVERRLGDIASCYADPSKANYELNWQTKYMLKDMCLSAWEFSKDK
tara:strand:- start:1935 stop:2936 length:1002 start_codon:yes stop_codon:yes gene_type:complete